MSAPDLATDKVQEQLEEGPSRYAAYAMRLRTLITASSRYIAYSSDIGEAFRPLTTPNFVRGAYAVSWAYLGLDVAYAGYASYRQRSGLLLAGPSDGGAVARGVASLPPHDVLEAEEVARRGGRALSAPEKVELRRRWEEERDRQQRHGLGATGQCGLVMARRAVFQSLASMVLPAFTIHSVVRYSAPLFARSSRQRVRAAGPTIAGLCLVPALPYMFDEPVEHAIDYVFDLAETSAFGAPVGGSTHHHHHHQDDHAGAKPGAQGEKGTTPSSNATAAAGGEKLKKE